MTPIFTSDEIPVDGPGTYGPVTTTVDNAGSYYWIASYLGDDNNGDVAGECGARVRPRSSPRRARPSPRGGRHRPTVPTTSVQDTATADGAVGERHRLGDVHDLQQQQLHDRRHHAGPGARSGRSQAARPRSSPGAYTGITTAGDYFFIARYSGDGNNNPVAGRCGDANEVVHTGALGIVKAVTPVAGNGVVVNFGDTLTYTLTVSATGTLGQPTWS